MAKIDSQAVLYSQGGNDECYTPRYVVEAILPFIPKDKVIWCPFDRDDSNFTIVLKENGYGIELNIDGVDYLMLHENDILATY